MIKRFVFPMVLALLGGYLIWVGADSSYIMLESGLEYAQAGLGLILVAWGTVLILVGLIGVCMGLALE